MDLSNESEGKHTLFAARQYAGGNLMLTPLLVTRDLATFQKAVAAVKALAADAPKLRRPTRGNARRIRVIGLEDRRAVFDAKAAGFLKIAPVPGMEFESIGHAALELGLSAKSLRQVFYLARRANSGIDAECVHLGIRFGYVDPMPAVSL